MNYYKWNFHSKAWCRMALQPKDNDAEYRIQCHTCDLDTTKSYPMGRGMKREKWCTRLKRKKEENREKKEEKKEEKKGVKNKYKIK